MRIEAPYNVHISQTFSSQQSNRNLAAVSRQEVAAVCVSALLNPKARNVSFYITKANSASRNIDDRISYQFESLTPEL